MSENIRPSLMVRNFIKAQAQGQKSVDTGSGIDWETSHEDILVAPELYPAKIVGYNIKLLWGDYPALLDGPPGNVVHGMAYKVQSQAEVDRLIAYQTDMYRSEGCLIKFEDGSDEILGNTFDWNADKALLKDRNV
ncbi:hypothetical protein VTN77DRAFT_961 [Rasamsonia byssochlamydoides]|uniref:uncharacterized protein n=1 Tax=Rasamsonia byssochlamydoides TaxID=89139 RepID=UPI003742C92D